MRHGLGYILLGTLLGSAAPRLAGNPVITNFTPAYAAYGDPNHVFIYGMGLYPGSTGTLTVLFGNTQDTLAKAVADYEIQAEVPAAAPAGPCTITVFVNGASASSLNDFVVVGPGPYVDSFSPYVGAGGNVVTLTGDHFLTVTSVTFAGLAGTSLFAQSTDNLQVTTPSGVTSGPIQVNSPSGSYTTLSNFFVPPVITGFAPNGGRPGTNVVLSGVNLLGALGVLVNGVAADFTVSNNTSLQFTVPAGASTGPVRINAPAGSFTTASDFLLLPSIYSFYPTAGPPSTAVTILGASFAAGIPAVRFNGVPATLQAGYSDTQLTTVVPSGATTGPISVTTTNGTGTSTALFYLPPVVSGFSPTASAAGTWITISGTNFIGTSAVSFNGTPALAFAVTNNLTLGAQVPVNAVTGPISVTAPAGTANSALSFYGPPAIYSFNPTHGAEGTVVTVLGMNFLGTTNVQFNGVTASAFTVSNNTTLAATAPAEASTGPITVAGPGGTATSSANFVVDNSDLAVSVAVTPSLVLAGSNLVYTIAVTNLGPAAAPDVVLVDTPSPLCTVLSSLPSQGQAQWNPPTLVATLGTLAVGGSATVALTVRAPTAPATLTNAASVSAGDNDPVPSNNSATNLTQVLPLPLLAIQSSSNHEVLVSWPINLSSFMLQFNSGLATNLTWSNLTVTPVAITNAQGARYSVTDTNSNPARFYRLLGQ